MNNKIAAGLLGVSALFVVGAADANPNGGFFARGRVLGTDPIFQTVSVNRPEERCWDERVEERHPGGYGYRSYTPGIAGAIIGGAIGSELGRGHNQDLATAAGALLGGSVGRDISFGARRPPAPASYSVQRRCEVVDHFEDHREIVGYRVKYEYDGRTFWTETRQDPGKWVDVHVSVNAVGDGR